MRRKLRQPQVRHSIPFRRIWSYLPGEGAVVSALPAELMLDPVRQIEGFVHACLVDATSGMILSALEEQDDMRLPVAAAGATDVVNVLSLMTGEMAANGEVEDVIVTLQGHYLLIRLVRPGP